MIPSIRDLFFPEKRVVGIDIGSHTLKLVEISDSPEGFLLSCIGQVPVEPGVIEDGLVRKPDILGKKLKELFKVSRSSVRNVVTALSGHTVVVKKTGFRHMDDEELRELITDEAGEYLPFDDSSAINFDCHILGENPMNQDQMDVIIAAAKKDVIKNYKDPIEKTGCKIVIMDVDTFALETAYAENYDFDDNDVVALLNIGASLTNINVVRGEESLFSRNILMGGNAITQAMAGERGISFEEAEMMKVAESEGGNGVQLLMHAEPIFQEIERTIDFFGMELGGVDIGRVIFSGGCARIPGITDQLSMRLRSEVEAFNPFQKIIVDEKTFSRAYLETIGPVAALCVGLALRRIDEI